MAVQARKLPSGSWRCLAYSHTEDIVMPDGSIKKKQVRKSFTCSDPSPYGKKECERMAAEWAAERDHERVEDITFGEAFDKYIDARESVLSPRTIVDYRRIRKHDMPELMEMKISRITQEDIQRCMNVEAQNHSPKTVRNLHGIVTAVLGTYRPNFKIHTDLPKKVRPNLYVPSDSDIQRLMEAVKGTQMELPVLLAAFGPMRRGEICALESSDIEGNIVHVCKNVVMNEDGGWTVKAPKSYAGDRYIDFPDFVAEKWQGISGRLVQLSPNTISHCFGKILDRAGLPHFRFHDLRHYAASIQHAIGVPDSYIMQRGGWGNDATLKSVYRHVLEDKESEMNQKTNNYFSSLADAGVHENDHEKEKAP